MMTYVKRLLLLGAVASTLSGCAVAAVPLLAQALQVGAVGAVLGFPSFSDDSELKAKQEACLEKVYAKHGQNNKAFADEANEKCFNPK